MFNTIATKYENIFFYDSDKTLPATINGIVREANLWSRYDKDVDIIITSLDYLEIYKECLTHNCSPIGIYNRYTGKVCDLKEVCLDRLNFYENGLHMLYSLKQQQKVKEAQRNFMQTGNLYSNITEVLIMLSNLCNYAIIHEKCPAAHVAQKEIMPSKMVYKILDELADDGFDGSIGFHVYNEPMIDPRLFMFIEYAKRIMPKIMIRIYTNGYYLTQNMIYELSDIGVNILNVTGYGKEEYKRLLYLDVPYPYTLLYGHLDDRLDYYSKNSQSTATFRPCKSYIIQVPIFSNGDIGACCFDYQHKYDLGNVFGKTLKDVLSEKRIIEFQKKVLSGDRTVFPLCQNCYTG